MLIATYRSEVTSSKPKKQSLTTRKKYDAWERQAIKRLLECTKTIQYGDAPSIVKAIEFLSGIPAKKSSKDFSVQTRVAPTSHA